MNPPDSVRPEPPGRGDGERVFDEPWQAQILAIADALVTNGLVTPADWSQTLGHELEVLSISGAPDTAETYYKGVTAAVEALLSRRGEISNDALEARVAAWVRAYERTPHGKPVEL